MWLEVIRDNHRAVALYQSLGFTVRHGLCGYLSAGQAEPRESSPDEYDLLSLLRHASPELEGATAVAAGSADLYYLALSGVDAAAAGLRRTGDHRQ